jgi:spore maturation protein CgeB
MRFVYFTHSAASCWNHGNAHFLRGVLRELLSRGHPVRIFEPIDGWSRANLVRDHGVAALTAFSASFPELTPELYAADVELDAVLDPVLDGADIVIVHEWTDPSLVAAIGRRRRRGAFLLLFHDTHHRAVSNPEAIRAFDLSGYDGVLAFGEALADIYRRRGWADRVFVWHEAADTRLFRPPAVETERKGLVWVGNWGDGERSAELLRFLLLPAEAAGLPLDIHGVRYPEEARSAIAEHGGRYRGWIANAEVPKIFSRYIATVHVPRRFYAEVLPGIPTIRVFEALACGIPLVSAPWEDSEELFRPGEDYLVARSQEEMTRHLRALASDPDLRAGLAANGLRTIAERHSCAHRVDALLSIIDEMRRPARRGAA